MQAQESPTETSHESLTQIFKYPTANAEVRRTRSKEGPIFYSKCTYPNLKIQP